MHPRPGDDGNGVLDTAEVESLLRFIYQTETISPKMAAMLEAADANHDRLISKGESVTMEEIHSSQQWY